MNTSLAIFKRNILTLARPISKSIFGTNDSIGLKYLFQLRVDLILLKVIKRFTILLILQPTGVTALVLPKTPFFTYM